MTEFWRDIKVLWILSKISRDPLTELNSLITKLASGLVDLDADILFTLRQLILYMCRRANPTVVSSKGNMGCEALAVFTVTVHLLIIAYSHLNLTTWIVGPARTFAHIMFMFIMLTILV